MIIKPIKSELLSLMNVGQATLNDLHTLGIHTLLQLKEEDPDDLYMRLCQLTGEKQDSCVWDVFAAIIHEAQTGEKKPWWQYSSIRKAKTQK